MLKLLYRTEPNHESVRWASLIFWTRFNACRTGPGAPLVGNIWPSTHTQGSVVTDVPSSPTGPLTDLGPSEPQHLLQVELLSAWSLLLLTVLLLLELIGAPAVRHAVSAAWRAAPDVDREAAREMQRPHRSKGKLHPRLHTADGNFLRKCYSKLK